MALTHKLVKGRVGDKSRYFFRYFLRYLNDSVLILLSILKQTLRFYISGSGPTGFSARGIVKVLAGQYSAVDAEIALIDIGNRMPRPALAVL